MQYRFRALFALLLAMILLYPSLHGGAGGASILANLLLSAMYGVGVWVVVADGRHRGAKIAVAIPAALGPWIGFAIPGQETSVAAVVFHGVAAIFMVLILVTVLRKAYREREITADAVFAALCGYILLGVAFGHGYTMIEILAPGSFKGDGWADHAGHEHVTLTYFSFITLTTVGYGDVLPASRHARSFSIVEAILGQFYIAVLIADLIGKRLSQGRGEE